MGASLAVTDRAGQTPLHVAVSLGESDTVNILLQRGAEVKVADRNQWTPLHYACQRGNVITVRDLIAKGADVTAITREGLQPIHVSAAYGHWGPIQLLELRGVDLATRDKEENTPLHIAAREGHFRLCRLLLSRGAEIAVVNARGLSPLAIAEENFTEIPETQGLTPMQVAKSTNSRQTIAYLRAVTFDNLAWAAEHGDSKAIDAILNLHPVYAQGDYLGVPLALIAARHGQRDAVATLFAHGAPLQTSPNSLDFSTALHEAASAGYTETVLWLLENGCEKNLAGPNGRTPAALAREQGHPDTAKVIDQFIAGGSS